MESDILKIVLDFGKLQLQADLAQTKVARSFYDNLPYSIELTSWGNELYGSIGIDLGKENPVPTIPPGGLAYTNKGNYFCVFYGQTPAWAVEHIGNITGNWKKFIDAGSSLNTVTIRRVE